MRWIKLEQNGDIPIARSSHSISSIFDGQKLVLWGGENAPRVPVTTDVSIYDIASSTWSTVAAPNAPIPRVAHAAAAVGNSIYFHGGRTEVGEASTLGDFYLFDAASSTWSELSPKGKTPMPRNYHSACSIGTNIYIFGGCGGALPDGATRRLADLWRYDTLAGTWEELPSSDAIKGRGGPGFVASDGYLWIIGGFTGKESSDTFRFNITAGKWEQVEVASTPGQVPFTARSVFGRGGHTCTSRCGHSGHILVFGGEIDPSDLGHAGAGQFSNTSYCLDPVTLTWHDVSVGGDIPGPRGWMASTELSGKGVVISGGRDDSNTRLTDLYYLDYHLD